MHKICGESSFESFWTAWADDVDLTVHVDNLTLSREHVFNGNSKETATKATGEHQWRTQKDW